MSSILWVGYAWGEGNKILSLIIWGKTSKSDTSFGVPSLKLTAKAPENPWLEDECFFLGPGRFLEVMLLLVLGRGIFVDPTTFGCFFQEKTGNDEGLPPHLFDW